MPSITDLFDPYNKYHVLAFMEVQYFGAWPQWFRNEIGVEWDSISFPGGWKNIIEGKMVEAYAEKMLDHPSLQEIREKAFGKKK